MSLLLLQSSGVVYGISLSCQIEERQNKILQGITLQTRDGRFNFGLTKPQQLSKIKRRNPCLSVLYSMEPFRGVRSRRWWSIVDKRWLRKRMFCKGMFTKGKIKFCEGSPLWWKRGRLNLVTFEVRNRNKHKYLESRTKLDLTQCPLR